MEEKKINENNKSLNESIISIRVELQNAKLKKSGKNRFAGFEYFELADFLPKLNELMLKENVNDIFSIEDEKAKLTLIKGEQRQEYSMPFVLFDTPVNIKENQNTGEVREVKSMQDIQYLGALNTYYKRYLYLNAFGITDGEVIDTLNNEEIKNTKTKKTETKITAGQVKYLQGLYTVDEIVPLLKQLNKTNVNDLTMNEASKLIEEKRGKANE